MVSPLRRHCDLLLRAYPASYRHRRGPEIRETLLDVSQPGAAWPPLGESVAIVGAGVRRRVGLAADQPLGELAELVAGWYLLLAVTLAGSALLLGEWAPWVHGRLRPPYGFGPFATDGVPVYALAVLAGLAWSLRQRGLARATASAAFIVATAMVVMEHHVSFWGRPPLSFVIPLLACLAPCVLRPAVGERRRRPDDRLIAGLAVLSAMAVPVWLGLVDLYLAHKYRYAQFWTGRGPDFYRLVVASVARWVPTVGAAALLAAIVLVILGRRDIAVGVAAMMAPWLLLAVLVAGSLTAGSSLSGSTFSAIATAAPSAALVTAGFAALALWLMVKRVPQATTAVD